MTSLLVRYAEVAQPIVREVGKCEMSPLDGASEMRAIIRSCTEHQDEFVGGEAMLFGAFISEAQTLVQTWVNEHINSVQVEYQDDLARFMSTCSDLEQTVKSVVTDILDTLVGRGFLFKDNAITAVEIRATATNRVCLTFRAQGDVVPLAGYLVRDGSDSWRPLPGRSVELDFINKYINFLVDHKAPHACRYSCAASLTAVKGG